ncbi:MAG: hypothetical protein H7Y86_02620 [Rhizobacter sp.]|nr:hypothetical protein [Ferruginibacter sp.]
MKTESDLNGEILQTTVAIQEAFPELSKYITEMPVTIPDESNPEINLRTLREYSDSLNTLVLKYAKSHIIRKK